MKFLSEIPPQKNMLHAHFLNVLLHCLATFFFFFYTWEIFQWEEGDSIPAFT